MSDGTFANNKNPDITYVSKAVGTDKNIRYISKVFPLKDFKDFYTSQKEKKVYEVIRESSTQEITAIYNESTTEFSIRIQRFSKETGAPHNQSFSFHGGALIKFIKFLESMNLLDLSSKENLKFTEKHTNELIDKKKTLNEFLKESKSISPTILIELFNKLKSEEKSQIFIKFLENINSYEAESLDAAIKQKEYKLSIRHLEQLLIEEENGNLVSFVQNTPEYLNYKANQPEKIFQNWIEQNLWIFGIEYHKKHLFKKIAEDNSQADIILETMDGFLSLIEVKRPISKNKLFRYDESHRCHFPAHNFSEAIGQCLIYLQRIEDFKKHIEKEHSVRILRPRIRLIIGRSSNFTKEEKEALHFINSSLHDIDVITYDNLIENGNKIISFYKKE